MKTIIICLVISFAVANCQMVYEIPDGFFMSGHYGTHFPTRKTYFRTISNHVVSVFLKIINNLNFIKIM